MYLFNYLDLSNFNTKIVIDICYMFYQCASLTILVLSNFENKTFISMCFMLYKYISLTTLDLLMLIIKMLEI